MDSLATLGPLLVVVGVAGYVVGIATPYPGRSFALTALMVGVTLLVVRPPSAAGGTQ
ncbi:hypothetical protein [Natronomonas sp. CBA1123]|jgi:hypothetical protein|uniref:hypothetical protein n=1 Tax=Natronomonas sp. CBA1123 TaxID=2668070 RepID=UPI0018D26F5E|nr:hypothetical protein [Natronomonas sp. CBA1123]